MSRWYSKQYKTRTTRAMKKWGRLMHEDTPSKRMASGVKLVKRPLCGWVLRVNWAKATASAANRPSVPMYDSNFDWAMALDLPDQVVASATSRTVTSSKP